MLVVRRARDLIRIKKLLGLIKKKKPSQQIVNLLFW